MNLIVTHRNLDDVPQGTCRSSYFQVTKGLLYLHTQRI
jgi:hypothetical protein